MKIQKIDITVSIAGVEFTGELLEIINLLHVFYKVPSPVIYQLMGEVGVFTVNPKDISFTRNYFDDQKLLFCASVKKI